MCVWLPWGPHKMPSRVVCPHPCHTLATPLPHPCLRGTQKANPDSQKGSIESFPLCIMLPVILVGFTDELIL